MSISVNKATWLVVLAVLGAGLAGLMFGSAVEEADAKKKKEPTTLWAQIQEDGLTTNYKGLTGNQRLGTGEYQIDFNRDVSQCAYTATASSGTSGDISTHNSGPQSVKVLTLTNDGSAYYDTPFHLVVNC